jgi:hypothetical protein
MAAYTMDDLDPAVRALVVDYHPEAADDGTPTAHTPSSATVELSPLVQRRTITAWINGGGRSHSTIAPVSVDARAAFETEQGTGAAASLDAWASARALDYGCTADEWKRRCLSLVREMRGEDP